MKQVLVCRNCEVNISSAISCVLVTEEILSTLSIGLPKPLVKQGTFLKSNNSIIQARYDYFKMKVRSSEDKTLGNWILAAKIRLARVGYSDQQVIDLNWLGALEAALTGQTGNKWSPKANLLHFAPQDWMNVDDLKNDLLDYNEEFEEEIEVGFCCGPSGLFGANFKCFCGIYVGTLCTECNAPEVFIPDPKETKWQNVK